MGTREEVEILLEDASDPDNEITVDLPNQKVIRQNGESFSFEMDPFRKMCLLNGLDKIGLTLEKLDYIESFETRRSETWPWLDGASMKVPDAVRMHGDAPIWATQDKVEVSAESSAE